MRHPVLETLRQIGWLDTALYGLARLLERGSNGRWRLFKYRLVAQTVLPPQLSAARGRAIDVRLIEQATHIGSGFPRDARVIAARFDQGASCLVALRGSELCGFLWWTTGAYQEDQVRARFALASSTAAWDFDVNVLPPYQLSLAFARLWDEANALLSARGVRWSCSRISSFNGGSLRAHTRLGAVTLGSAVFVCLGSWQWTFATLAPYCHLSRRADQFPRFFINPEASCRTATK